MFARQGHRPVVCRHSARLCGNSPASSPARNYPSSSRFALNFTSVCCMSFKAAFTHLRLSLRERATPPHNAFLTKCTAAARQRLKKGFKDVRCQSVLNKGVQGLEADLLWKNFIASWSGEWEGVTATFNSDGTARPLPHLYVPDAFREWGVEVFDWQSQCSCKPESGAGDASYVVRRLMPTVGCEADAVASTDQHSHVWEPEDLPEWGSMLPLLPEGSFTAGPLQLPADGSRAMLEACLVSQPQQERVRLVAEVVSQWQDPTSWQLLSVEVHKEQYDAPFNNGQDLRSCGFRMNPISSEPLLQQEALMGDWRAQPGGVSLARESASQPLSAEAATTPNRWSSAGMVTTSFMGLPAGTYCKLQSNSTSVDSALAAFEVELGSVQSGGSMLKCARFVYVGGVLVRVLLGADQLQVA